jgi:hypothetical protein
MPYTEFERLRAAGVVGSPRVWILNSRRVVYYAQGTFPM